MEAMRQSWTDERLDDLNRSVAERFDHVDRRFDQVDRRLEQMEKRFEHVDREVQAMRSEMHMRFDSAQKTTVHAILAMTAAMIAGYAAVIGLFATQV
jgi:DNA anti-recombination protein RmuC